MLHTNEFGIEKNRIGRQLFDYHWTDKPTEKS